MPRLISQKLAEFLHWSQKYTKTDMIYATKGGFWILTEKIGIFIVSFITMAVFGRWLPKEVYGTYQFVIAGLGIAGIFALSGMSTALVRGIAQNKEGTLILVIKEKIKWSLIGSLGLLLVSVWYLINQNVILAGSFFLAAIFLPFRETFNISPVFWIGKKRFDIVSKFTIYPAVLALFVIIPVIYITNNILWVIFVTLASHVIFDGFFLLKTIRRLNNNERDKSVISFGKNLTAMDAIVKVSGNIDQVILWQFLGPAQLAIYSFAQFPIKALGGIVPIHELALPKLGERNVKGIKKGLINKFCLLFFLSIPVTLLIIIFAPFVYRIFFPGYLDSVIYFQALSLIVVLMPFNLLGAALISDVRKKELYIIRIGSALLKIILFLALVSFYGIWGIVIAILITEVIRMGMIFYYFQKI